MNKNEWTQGLEQWEKVKKQAIINQEQAELYIEAIQKKIAEFPKEETEEVE